MAFIVDSAVILAAGTSSRFAPLSAEQPKGLTEVRGERLILRQIRQLQAAGIPELIVVTGYMADAFADLARIPGVRLVHNPEWAVRNNHASLRVAAPYLGHSYICSADNYFTVNPFTRTADRPYYAAVYAEGPTDEWCLTVDATDRITGVTVGGADSWVMMGHALWDRTFSARFLEILAAEYDRPETADRLWEAIYAAHLDRLTLTLRRYPADRIFEFDTLEELRAFDPTYIRDTRSRILKAAAAALGTTEDQLTQICALRPPNRSEAIGCTFRFRGQTYTYDYAHEALTHD